MTSLTFLLRSYLRWRRGYSLLYRRGLERKTSSSEHASIVLTATLKSRKSSTCATSTCPTGATTSRWAGYSTSSKLAALCQRWFCFTSSARPRAGSTLQVKTWSSTWVGNRDLLIKVLVSLQVSRTPLSTYAYLSSWWQSQAWGRLEIVLGHGGPQGVCDVADEEIRRYLNEVIVDIQVINYLKLFI